MTRRVSSKNKEKKAKKKNSVKKRDQKRYKETENDVDGSRTRLIYTFKQLLDHCTTVIHINLDFPRLLCELQNSNSPKNKHSKNFLEETQSLFLYFVYRGIHNCRLKDLENFDLTCLVFPPDYENLT